MKVPVFIAAAVGVVAVNAQNYPSDMPSCGTTCGNNMFAKATSDEIGCDSSTDYDCLCSKPNFLYGIRDCSEQYCQNNTAANIAIDWANSFCASYSGTISVSSETGTYSGNGTGVASTPTATTTATETITSGSSTYVTTISSTLYGPVATTITSEIVSTGTSGGSSFTTTLGTSTITTENPSGTEATGPSSPSTTTSSSSSAGAAPRMTAVPVAWLLAAGLAAVIL